MRPSSFSSPPKYCYLATWGIFVSEQPLDAPGENLRPLMTPVLRRILSRFLSNIGCLGLLVNLCFFDDLCKLRLIDNEI